MKQKLVFLFIMTLLVACSGTPEPTAAVEPTATDVPATATSEPSETPEPTATKKPTRTPKPTNTKTPKPTNTKTPKPTNTKTPKPTNTKTPKPTNTKTPKPTNTKTPRPTNTSTATATPEATATPDYIAYPPRRQGSPERESTGRRKYYPPGSYEFIHNQFYVPQPPAQVPTEYVAALPGVSRGICPLTGQTASPEWLQRRPINVRFDNSPSGRPQAGMEGADVVWEALAEGGLTRLTATFHCQAPNMVGPLRSARLMDLQITPMLEAWLVHAGAAQPVTDMIWASPYADRSINEWESAEGFYRIDRAPLGWLRTYSNNQLIRSVINQTDNVNLPAPLRGWIFNQTTPRGATGSAREILIPYQAGPVNYYYNAGSGRYARYQGETAHTQQSGYHLAPRNIMVILSRMSRSTIVEDSNGALSLHFKLHGKGDALLFRNGQVWEAEWRREGENTLIRIVDEDGYVIPLAIGQTWVQIVPDTMEVQWEE